MLPERALLDIVDEPNRREVQIPLPLLLHHLPFDHVPGLRRASDRPLERHGLVIGDGPRQLRGAEDVGKEGVVVEAPDAVGAGGLEGVGQDEPADGVEVSGMRSVSLLRQVQGCNIRLQDGEDDLPLDLAAGLPVLEGAQFP